MKKFLLLIPVIILVLWASLTWIIGSSTQSGYTLAIEALNNNLGPASKLTSITDESYSRGFLSSEAVTKFTVGDKTEGGTENKNNEVYLKFKAWHGPLMMTPEGIKIGSEYVIVTLDKDRLPDEIRKIIDEGFKGAEPAKLGILTGFGGNVALNAEVAPFSSKDAGPNTVNFEGFTIELETDVIHSVAKGKVNIGALTVEDKKGGSLFSIAEATGEMDYNNLIMNVTGDGTANLDFPEIKIVNKDESYAVKDLHFDNSSKQSDGKLYMTNKFSIGGFKGSDKGNNAELMSKMDGKLELEITAEGMDVEALKIMAGAQRKLQEAQAGEAEDPDAAEKALHDYVVAASSLLQPGYKMKNHIAFTNKSGKSELGLGLQYTGGKPLFELETVRDLLDALEVALNLQIGKDLIPPAMIEQIKPAISMKFIQDKGNAFKSDAILSSGKLTVNGEETDALKQLGPILDMPIPWENLGIKNGQ